MYFFHNIIIFENMENFYKKSLFNFLILQPRIVFKEGILPIVTEMHTYLILTKDIDWKAATS